MIFLDTNVLSESFRKAPSATVAEWMALHDPELALSTVVIAEIAFGIKKIAPAERASRLDEKLSEWRQHFAGRIFGLTEEAAMAYGEIMGMASRRGATMLAPDGMIAAIAHVNGGRLATRNLADFKTTGLKLISPWNP